MYVLPLSMNISFCNHKGWTCRFPSLRLGPELCTLLTCMIVSLQLETTNRSALKQPFRSSKYFVNQVMITGDTGSTKAPCILSIYFCIQYLLCTFTVYFMGLP
jgi:hypothetical protein